MTSGFMGRASNVRVGTKKCVLYFRCFGPQKWLRPEVSGGVDGDTKHYRRHHHRADGVPRPVFPPTRSSVHWPDSCDGSWAIGVQVNVWRTFPAGGKHSTPDDVTCNIPGCGSELGGRRYRADCFSICRQRERCEKLGRCLVRDNYSNTLAYRWSVCFAASDDSSSLNEFCSHSPTARLHNGGPGDRLPQSIACPAATVGGQVLTGGSRSERKQKNCVPGNAQGTDCLTPPYARPHRRLRQLAASRPQGKRVPAPVRR